MKITFDHAYGQQTVNNIRYVIPRAEVLENEEKLALETGWLFDSDVRWYQCRSVRIKLSEYKEHKKWSKRLGFKIGTIDDFNAEALETIYSDYIKYKNFVPDHPYICFDTHNKALYGVIYDSDVPVAFTKFTQYNGGLESYMFCWNYHKPQLSLGKLIQDKEVEYAKSIGLEYLYVGEGYEHCCIYKASFGGFEWWTGKEWSTDKEQYIKLCERDSNIKNISELNNISTDL